MGKSNYGRTASKQVKGTRVSAKKPWDMVENDYYNDVQDELNELCEKYDVSAKYSFGGRES